jgi:AcrR family transcriptional regulator
VQPDPISSVFPRPRRTQQERRETTRTALLDATIASLVELGYSGATTLDVERRAGVSRGARIHHFPTKALLLASAVDYLYGQLGDHYEQAFGRTREDASDAERMRSGLRLLWSVYSRPDYAAVLELSMAARTDAELREHLHAVGDRHRALAIEAAGKYFPTLDGATAERLVLCIHATLIGLLMERNVIDDLARDDAVLSTLQSTVAIHLPQPQRPAATDGSKPSSARR